MKLVTSQQMRELDRAATLRHRIPSLMLMERAGVGVAEAARRLLPPGGGTVAVVAGGGNNGGDGLVAARHLVESGVEVFVVMLTGPAELSPDARANWERLAPLTARISTAVNAAAFAALAQADVDVDAIFGTGLARPPEGLAAQAIAAMNELVCPVVAVDLPSGLSADTGMPQGIAVRAEVTVTFGLPKRGLVLGEGPAHVGRVEVVDIGLPAEEVAKLAADLELIEPSLFAAHFAKRDPKSHKGDYGHVAVFAGSRGHLGAGYLACLAALRAGAGLATYALPEKAFAKFDARYPEIMCDAIPDNGTAAFHPEGLAAALAAAGTKTALAIGPAVGTEQGTREFVNALVRKTTAPLVVDADGLNVLDLDALAGRKGATILTPHPGEMGRLLSIPTQQVEADRIGCALRLAQRTGAVVVLKGAGTIVATPDGVAAINTTGNAGMATAGMGDALTGVVVAFLAQGMEAKTAAYAAVWVHGLAGDLAAAELSERALITSDVIRKLGGAMQRMTKDA